MFYFKVNLEKEKKRKCWFYLFDLLNYYHMFCTEIMNLRNLERVLAREEEVKKRAVVHKAVYSGPQIRYLSRNGKLALILITAEFTL